MKKIVAVKLTEITWRKVWLTAGIILAFGWATAIAFICWLCFPRKKK